MSFLKPSLFTLACTYNATGLPAKGLLCLLPAATLQLKRKLHQTKSSESKGKHSLQGDLSRRQSNPKTHLHNCTVWLLGQVTRAKTVCVVKSQGVSNQRGLAHPPKPLPQPHALVDLAQLTKRTNNKQSAHVQMVKWPRSNVAAAWSTSQCKAPLACPVPQDA